MRPPRTLCPLKRGQRIRIMKASNALTNKPQIFILSLSYFPEPFFHFPYRCWPHPLIGAQGADELRADGWRVCVGGQCLE